MTRGRSATVAGWSLAVLLACMLPAAALSTPALAGNVLPPTAEGPVTVTMGIYVIDITNIDEVAETFSAEIDVVGSWIDPRLAFEPDPGEPTTKVFIGSPAEALADDSWMPQLTAVNATGALPSTKLHIEVGQSGAIKLRARIHGQFRTPLSFRRFPFDRQSLVLHVQSFSWDADTLVLVDDVDASGVDEELELAEWQVLGYRTTVAPHQGSRDHAPLSRYTFVIEIERRTGFYVWKVIIPLLTLVAVSWVVFWMSSEGLARRAGVSMTGLLTVVAYQFIVSDWLPRIAYLTVMDKMMLVSFGFIAATMVENFTVRMGRWEENPRAVMIDRTCRWAFPVLYAALLFLIVKRSLF